MILNLSKQGMKSKLVENILRAHEGKKKYSVKKDCFWGQKWSNIETEKALAAKRAHLF
jgi:hypothetical protein